MLASLYGHLDVVNSLLAAGANVNIQNKVNPHTHPDRPLLNQGTCTLLYHRVGVSWLRG